MMASIPRVNAARNSGLQDDHEPNDSRQTTANQKSPMEGPAAYAPHDEGEKKGQGIVRDERGQDQPADKKNERQTSSQKQRGQDNPTVEAGRAFPNRDSTKKKTGES